MFKALFKKQLIEINLWLIRDNKTGKRRSKAGIVGLLILYIWLFAIIAGMFAILSFMICEPFASLGLSWLYFTIMGLSSVVFGVFGGVFNTYASLYNAKDNDLLLSMPIPPSKILITRLFGVWFWGTVYSSLVYIPAIVIYMIFGAPTPLSIICSVLILLAISFFVLSLSCILGWAVAKISSKLKNKSFITVILSLAFIAVYYVFYTRLNVILTTLISNALVVGEAIKGYAFPLYMFGEASTGNILYTLVYILAIAIIFSLVYLVLAKTFLKITTSNSGTAKKKYKKERQEKKSEFSALIRKELRRFTSSPTYMLNCGLGIILIPAFAVFAIFNAEKLQMISLGLYELTGMQDLTILGACAALCFISSMIDISAPSVSLEGKNIWILHSLPVSPLKTLEAKLALHLIFAEIPTLLASIAFIVILKPTIIGGIFMILIPAAFALMLGLFGLFANLLFPNMVWTNEIVPIKQSPSVALALFAPWVLVLALGGLYFLLMKFISAQIYMLICLLIILLLSYLMYLFLKGKGSRIFKNL